MNQTMIVKSGEKPLILGSSFFFWGEGGGVVS